MRFLHTADWHLGRIFHGVHLTEDQAHLLDQLVDLVREARVDAVLVAGDVYDRAVPPPEAVALLDETLSRIVLDLGVPVVVVAGNHDSPERLAFGSRLLGRGGLHVAGAVAPADGSACAGRPLVLSDDHGPVEVWAVPYVEPAVARARLGDDTLHDHDRAVRAVLIRTMASGATAPGPGASGRRVLVTHAFVAGGRASESERPLSVGGSGAVEPACFEGWSYVALGHLHRPQTAGGDHIRYAGSLFRYSFDETDHPKSVSLVDLDGRGGVRVEHLALTPRREVRRVEGRLSDLLAAPTGSGAEDYLLVTLLDEGPVYDALGRLREVFPNLLHIERSCGTLAGAGGQGSGGAERLRLGDLELFRAFFDEVTGQELTPAETGVFTEVVEGLRRAEREAER